MTLWTVLRNLRVRAVATALTLLGVALATATALLVPLVLRSLERGAADAAQVFDLLIAARGSPTQAVLSSLYLLQPPIANLPFATYERLARDPRSRYAIPLGFGDNYRGFPLLGTNAQVFQLRLKPSAPPYFRLRAGRTFTATYEAVLGARAARETGLRIGDRFLSAHGFFASQAEAASAAAHHQEERYRVVGVLEATGGPWDRAIFVPIEAYWEVHGEGQSERQVTAVLYTGRRLSDVYQVAQEVNREGLAQAVFPGQVFAQTRELLLQGQSAYGALSLLVLALAALLVWQGVYAGGLERRRRTALLRALGAGRGLVFGVVLLETLLEVALGVALGLLLGWSLAALGAGVLGERLGFFLPPPQLSADLVARVSLLLPLGLLAALPPALQAARESPLEYL
ncbi:MULTISPECIES: ABC transporter permease [unclassified Meiothermus]|uniref:ABC transporter permease n=1 Tax=unclassified Meiothermus TaxID=370471 RepID=UPI000D7BD91F|nr:MULTISPECIES: ABC transporter permease [unclassified Meiothermus]PZA07643.1 ABC transporter permease [Meiothermus sp. Pnk-1]RYM36480.1 FtsX-like permease family protein [Meiothermus sp. PNK-Is4]